MRLTLISFSFLIIFGQESNCDLASEVRTLKRENKDSKRFRDSQSVYCKINSIYCGECLCKDDFSLPSKYYCDCQHLPPKRDCLEFYKNRYYAPGIYTVTMNGLRTAQVYCIRGSTVIQRRFDGSVNFYRSWKQYKEGFGKLQGEFWLGNDLIHLLTLQGLYPKGSKLNIWFQSFDEELKSHTGTSYFDVESERTNYTLHVSGRINMGAHNNQQFSTYDRDNDNSTKYNCAKDHYFGGGWHYGDEGGECGAINSNVNGIYDKYNEMSSTNPKTLHIRDNAKLSYIELGVERST